MNGFEHLDAEIHGSDEFDLGFKFARNQIARVPWWLLYISYHSTWDGPVKKGTLHYEPSDETVDQETLFSLAKPHIARALAELRQGGSPSEADATTPRRV
jgi:hypothetical protein